MADNRVFPAKVVPAGVRRLLTAVLLAALCGCAYTPIAVPEAAQADADLLFKLGLMRGHLMAGHALYALGEHAAAGTHAKHPSDELYMDVAVALERRGAPPFAAELAAHAEAMASGAADLTDAYADLLTAIAAAENAVTDASAALRGRVIVLLLREAAREYAIGVVDGQLENAHEYQDAYGFTHIALGLARVQHMRREGDDREVFRRIVAAIEPLGDMWPNLAPPPRIPQHAIRIDAVAAEVEQMALRLSAPGRFR